MFIKVRITTLIFVLVELLSMNLSRFSILCEKYTKIDAQILMKLQKLLNSMHLKMEAFELPMVPTRLLNSPGKVAWLFSFSEHPKSPSFRHPLEVKNILAPTKYKYQNKTSPINQY